MQKARFFNLCPFQTNSSHHSFTTDSFQSADIYLQNLQQHSRWADEHGLYGTLVYNFNNSLDPLLLAQLILSMTKHLHPLIAVQPAQIHPFTLMRAVATLTYLYQRNIDLNMVTGASPVDMHKTGDLLSEQQRHERLREYVKIIRSLSEGKTTVHGQYFQVNELSIDPPIPQAYRPRIYIPGSSAASCQTVQAFAHSSLFMAKPLAVIREEIARITGSRRDLTHAMLVGIITRPEREEALAATRSPIHQDRRTRLTSRLFIAQSSSHQHKANLEFADQGEVFDGMLWYGSAKIGIDAPKLVGSYTEVRDALQRYIELGITDILIDLPDSFHEYDHISHSIQSFL